MRAHSSAPVAIAIALACETAITSITSIRGSMGTSGIIAAVVTSEGKSTQ